jgi:hypothetical protein
VIVLNRTYDYLLASHVRMRCVCGDFLTEDNHWWIDIDYVADKIIDCSKVSPDRVIH